ncbi:hypothetical protein GCM10009555_041990 [Acrocarpospora macrocephala]|uniref:Uncharacterized protein n=1 Tax=Acrocarpospora macrocephala TaxID=150177 RepID=A0A5M3X6D6_9ACTN|nr:hypothetical protein Amac_073150 [Acrocarpospora macrocephala]
MCPAPARLAPAASDPASLANLAGARKLSHKVTARPGLANAPDRPNASVTGS